MAKSARTTYAAATTATATASGGRRSDLAAGAEGASAFAMIVAQRFAGLLAFVLMRGIQYPEAQSSIYFKEV